MKGEARDGFEKKRQFHGGLKMQQKQERKVCSTLDLLALFNICMQINANQNLHVFFEYSAHVDLVGIKAYPSDSVYEEGVKREVVYSSDFYARETEKYKAVLSDLSKLLVSDQLQKPSV